MRPVKLTLLFPTLSVIAFYLLWVLMLQNGTIDAMDNAVRRQRFADGTPLQTVYSGFAPLDHALATLVAFTYYPTEGTDQNTRFLYIDILSTLQTAHLWCLVEGLRSGRTSLLLAMPAIWGLLWNGFGAAVVLPLYAFLQVRHRSHRQNIGLHNARALVPALVFGSYPPSVLVMAPPFVSRQPIRHQSIIALFQMTPLYVAALHYALSQILGLTAKGKAHHPHSDLLWVRGAFAFAGLASSMTHVYALAGGIQSKGGLHSMYAGISNFDVSAAGVGKVALGAALFLQYDCAIINICTLIWGFLLVRESARVDTAHLIVVLVVMNALFGPGATMSAVFWWRESKIRAREMQRGQKSQGAIM